MNEPLFEVDMPSVMKSITINVVFKGNSRTIIRLQAARLLILLARRVGGYKAVEMTVKRD